MDCVHVMWNWRATRALVWRMHHRCRLFIREQNSVATFSTQHAPNNHKFRHDSHQTSAPCYVCMHLSTDVFTAVVAFFLQSADLKQMYAQSEWFNQIKVCISCCVAFVGVSCIIWFTLTRHHSLAALAVLAKMLFKKMFFRMCNCLITPQVLIVCTLLLSAGVYICLLFVLVRRCLSAIFGKVVTKGSPLKWTVC